MGSPGWTQPRASVWACCVCFNVSCVCVTIWQWMCCCVEAMCPCLTSRLVSSCACEFNYAHRYVTLCSSLCLCVCASECVWVWGRALSPVSFGLVVGIISLFFFYSCLLLCCLSLFLRRVVFLPPRFWPLSPLLPLHLSLLHYHLGSSEWWILNHSLVPLAVMNEGKYLFFCVCFILLSISVPVLHCVHTHSALQWFSFQ